MDGSVLEQKPSFKILGLSLSSKLGGFSEIISIVKASFKKIGDGIYSVKYLSPEDPMYLCKSTIGPCMENCCYA